MVIQRDNANRANVQVAGNYYQTLDKIEARVVPIRTTWGTATNWQAVTLNPQNGTFQGNLTVQGGWYRLEVRGVSGATFTQIDADTMGVGEVFVIAGQSNAQGYTQASQRDPNDERIICVNKLHEKPFGTDPDFPVFERMNARDFLAPTGQSAWCWGPLGELITQRLNVPVVFFNAARGSTTIRNWRDAAEGRRAINRYCSICPDEGGRLLPVGAPYEPLRLALGFFGSLTGVRAVLWHQGESDGFPLNTSLANYRDDLTAVIQKSRADIGRSVPWVVARASYTYDNPGIGTITPSVIDGQNSVILTVPNVFPGPATDNIQNPREASEGSVHFSGIGHYQLAQAWYDAISTVNFTNNALSAPPQALLPISVVCKTRDTLTLSSTRTPYAWSNGRSTASISVGGGTYTGKIRETVSGANFTLFTQPYAVPARPVIQHNGLADAAGGAYFCDGNSITLRTQYAQNHVWNNGGETPNVIVTSPGNYSVVVKDLVGCTYGSVNLGVTRRARPSKPTLTTDGPLSFCQGTIRTLTSSANRSYVWNNGETTQSIRPTVSRWYAVRVVDASQCQSLPSDSVRVSVNPIPEKPVILADRTILADRSVTMCNNEILTLTSSSISDSLYLWTNASARTRSITTQVAGQYQLRVISRQNCASALSDPITLRLNAAPSKPTVTVLGNLAFCEGQSVTLRNNGTLGPIWLLGSSQISTTNTHVAAVSGEYFARVTDANNCSNISDRILIAVRPRPETPRIVQVGAYTLEAQANTLSVHEYSWQIGSDSTLTATNVLKAPKAGLYTVRSTVKYNISPYPAFVCRSNVSTPFGFSYSENDDDGLTVYPNPVTSGVLTVETKLNHKNALVEIFTLEGKNIFSEQSETLTERKTINLNGYRGILIIQVSTPEGYKTYKRVFVRQ